jgi:hypothetical protein
MVADKVAGRVVSSQQGEWQDGCTVQTVDLNLSCIRRIPKMHSWIEHKFLLQLLLCILGLFLPPNFTLSFHHSGLEVALVRIQSEDK